MKGKAMSEGIPRRMLGKTGVEVTILGLGGEGILRTNGHEREAYAVINRAIDLGINYCESARAYDGSESYYGLALRERRSEIFLTSKSHARSREGALAHLHETLENMKTDHLDLWQVHDVRSQDDIAAIFGLGGAMEAFVEAREKGVVRFIGVTGHHDPAIISACIERFPFDTVLFPVNPAEPAHSSFLSGVLPMARQREMGIIGMKVYFRGLAARIPGHAGMEPYLRFALSQPVSTVVIGCDDLDQLEENVRFASAFRAMSDEDQAELVAHVAPYASQLMYYKPQG
jgi:aryl-alcohol dehydrogenase-like predicted oxidoreductase